MPERLCRTHVIYEIVLWELVLAMPVSLTDARLMKLVKMNLQFQDLHILSLL